MHLVGRPEPRANPMIPDVFRALTLALLAALAAGCNGKAALSLFSGDERPVGDDGSGGSVGEVPSAADPAVVRTELRRLSRAEIAASIQELLGVAAPETFVLLPEDEGEPFDNEYTHQQASLVLVEAAES